MLLVVDARSGVEHERTARIELNSQVHSWVPMLGDVAAGLASCTQVEYGSMVQLDLKPGEGVLIMINMLAKEDEYNSHSHMSLLASNETISQDDVDVPTGYERRPLSAAAGGMHAQSEARVQPIQSYISYLDHGPN